MTVLTVAAALTALLVLGATAGPALLARLAPALSARPRWGMAVWASAALLWALGLLSVGPLLAWTVTGPGLPGAAGAVCRRCLAAANPFAPVPGWTTQVLPTYLLLLVPAAAAAGLLGYAAVRLAANRRELRRQLRTLAAVAELRQVQGTATWVLPSAERMAYALPRHRAGIVVTQGTLDGLDDDQVAAVIAHERAHVRGRHHAVIGALQVLAWFFSPVPLVAAAPAAVAGYAEMAADDAARSARGTRALAGALLALHRPAPSGAWPTLALHAARHQPLSRAQRLVAAAPPPSRTGVTVVAAYLIAMAGAVLLVSVPYLSLAAAASC